MGQILLVRHGQASWDAADYDVLSPLGFTQSVALGLSLKGRGVLPGLVVRGAMRRHRETEEAAQKALGSSVVATVDEGWNEFDHVAMLAAHPADFGDEKPTKDEFQEWFEAATHRWTGGAHDDYAESFTTFAARVDEALRRTAEQAASGTAIVFTSGGPISWVVASLLADDRAQAVALWLKLNPVCVNSSVTRLVTGRRGLTLVNLNDHSHVEGVPGLLTYR